MKKGCVAAGALVAFIVTGGLASRSHATIYYSEDMEARACGSLFPGYFESFQGYTKCASTPQGSKYLEWNISSANANNAYIETPYIQGHPVSCSMGTTYYLATLANFTRINGNDIWHEGADQSYDKAYEMDGNGLRWIIGIGQHESYCANANTNHHFTAFLFGNRTTGQECVDWIQANVSPYRAKVSPIQLDYERWYAYVMGVKISNNGTGSVTLWVNGIKILEYTNITTVSSASPTINEIKLNGTLAQPAYDSPPHYRKFDALLLTDNFQDLVDRGYMKDPSNSSDTTPPANPMNLRFQ